MRPAAFFALLVCTLATQCDSKFIKAPVALQGEKNVATFGHERQIGRFLGLLPTNLTDLYSHLTPRQERIMDDAVKGNDGNEAAFLAYIRRKDAKLGIKAAKVFKEFILSLTKTKPRAQRFYLTVCNALHQRANRIFCLFSSSTVCVSFRMKQTKKRSKVSRKSCFLNGSP